MPLMWNVRVGSTRPMQAGSSRREASKRGTGGVLGLTSWVRSGQVRARFHQEEASGWLPPFGRSLETPRCPKLSARRSIPGAGASAWPAAPCSSAPCSPASWLCNPVPCSPVPAPCKFTTAPAFLEAATTAFSLLLPLSEAELPDEPTRACTPGDAPGDSSPGASVDVDVAVALADGRRRVALASFVDERAINAGVARSSATSGSRNVTIDRLSLIALAVNLVVATVEDLTLASSSASEAMLL
mmetsp:Transcript_48994/g.97760  ORF Transcript_48994/g.97760 Transcript_48994/m.97760 type:complete len:243 (+) Transcript_48994:120-848(+)